MFKDIRIIDKNAYLVKKTFNAFLPMSIFFILISGVSGTIDTVFAGNFIGEDALCAIGLSVPIFILNFCITSIYCYGGITAASMAMGSDNKEQYNDCFTVSIISSMAIGGVISVLGFFFSDWVAVLFGASGNLVDPTSLYLKGIFLSMLPNTLFMIISFFIKLDGSVNLPLVMVIAYIAGKLIFNSIFFVVMSSSIFMLGVANAIGLVIGTLIAYKHFSSEMNSFKFTMPKAIFSQFINMFKLAAPILVTDGSAFARGIFFNLILASCANVYAFAAFNGWSQMYQVVGAVSFGLIQVCGMLMGMFAGDEDRISLKDTFTHTLKMNVLWNGSVAVILFAVAPWIAEFMGANSPQALEIVTYGIRGFAVVELFFGMSMIISTGYQCTGKILLGSVINFCHMLLFPVLVAYALLDTYQEESIFIAVVVGNIITIVLVYLYAVFKNKKLVLSVEEFLMLEKDFGNRYKKVELSIMDNMATVEMLSKNITQFLQSIKLSDKVTKELSMCIGSIASNIIKFGLDFNSGHWLEIIIIDKNNEVWLEIRDNGRRLTPIEYMKRITSEDTSDMYMGMMPLKKMADSMIYSNNMGINKFVVVISK